MRMPGSTPRRRVPSLGSMFDVRVPPSPGVPGGLTIPEAELSERYSRSSGPGGQGVNTTDSRVQLSWDVGASSALSDAQRARLLLRLAPRLIGTVLTINAAEYRSQRRNRTAARDRLAALIVDGLRPPAPARRRRGPSVRAQQRRLEGKRLRSELKRSRRRPVAE